MLAMISAVICLLFGQATCIRLPYGKNVSFSSPPCLSEPLYKNNPENPDIFSSMYACVDNITDALDPPSYLKNAPPVETFSSFQVNGMMSLSELEGTATFDFFWRIYWLDQRMNMPAFWTAINETRPELTTAGIDITGMVYNQEPLNVWLPDLFLTTAKEVNVLDETIRIRPGGVMFWSRHMVATLQENSFGEFDLQTMHRPADRPTDRPTDGVLTCE
jgi:hypothetical protein